MSNTAPVAPVIQREMSSRRNMERAQESGSDTEPEYDADPYIEEVRPSCLVLEQSSSIRLLTVYSAQAIFSTETRAANEWPSRSR